MYRPAECYYVKSIFLILKAGGKIINSYKDYVQLVNTRIREDADASVVALLIRVEVALIVTLKH